VKLWQALLLLAIVILAGAFLVSLYFIATGPRM
jgi:hypothetical protein